MSEELLIKLGNASFYAFAKLKQYQQLEGNCNFSLKMSGGFASQLVITFLDNNKVIMTKGGCFFCELHLTYALNITSIFPEFQTTLKKMIE